MEVKGTRTNGITIALTKNEVAFAQQHDGACELFILHSITVNSDKNPKATGGTRNIIAPWNLTGGTLTPTKLVFDLWDGGSCLGRNRGIRMSGEFL